MQVSQESSVAQESFVIYDIQEVCKMCTMETFLLEVVAFFYLSNLMA